MNVDEAVAEALKRFDRIEHINVYDRRRGHMIVYGDRGKYYIIYTGSVLRNPRSLGIDYEGEMLGVRTSVLMMDVSHIVWVVDRDGCIKMYMQSSREVHRWCIDTGAIYRNRATGEQICNYPVKMATKIYERCVNTLDKYINTTT